MKRKWLLILSILIVASLLSTTHVSRELHFSKQSEKKWIEKWQEEQKSHTEDIERLNKELNILQDKLKKTQETLDQWTTAKNEELDPTRKIAYLTFDDGPSPNTVRNLDTLKKYGIHATFFVNGHPGLVNEELYRRIVDEGHALGNHTYSHDYAKIYRSVDAFEKDVQKLDKYLFSVTGIHTKLVRFPGGSNNTVSYRYGGKGVTREIAADLKHSGYQYFDWNVDSADASAITQRKNVILNNVLNQSRGKTKVLILMHDSGPKTTTADALPQMIEGLRKQGFEFRPLHSYSFTNQFIK